MNYVYGSIAVQLAFLTVSCSMHPAQGWGGVHGDVHIGLHDQHTE